MTKRLTLEEMIDVARDIEPEGAECEREDFGGTCATFYATNIGQPCPEPLQNYDEGEWSTEDGTDLDSETGKEI